MKKQNLLAIVATLAVVANLLVPGLAFGQSQQGGTQQVTCGQRYMHIYDDASAQDINFSFNPVSVSTGVQYTYGQYIGTGNMTYQNNGSSLLPANSFVYVEDNTSNCPTGGPQWSITVSATDFGASFPATGLKLATTGNVAGWGQYDTNGDGTKDTAIPWEPTTLGSTQYLKAVAPSETGINVPAALANYTDSTLAKASFDSAGISLGGAGGVILQNSSTADYTPGFWGVGTAFRLAVPANTPAGTYTSTITYTFNPAA